MGSVSDQVRRPTVRGGIVVAVTLGAVGFLPLFAGPDYEAAVAAGVVLPSVAAVTAAFAVRDSRSPARAYSRGLAIGAWFAFIAVVVTLLHGLRVGFCDVPTGLTLFGLGPAMGSLCGGAVGACVGGVLNQRARRSRRRTIGIVVCAMAPPVIGIGVSLYRFFSSPMVFAFDPFFGYFSGSVYDTVIGATPELLSYRAGTVASLAFGYLVALHLRFARDGQIQSAWPGRAGLVVLGAGCAVVSGGVTISGSQLGHYHTSRSIRLELAGTETDGRCTVVHDRALRRREMRLFARDCNQHIAQLERYFEHRFVGTITAYVFRDASQKRRLMGAANVYIAKPWRREVYLQASGFPHAVLGHELAHVVAGDFAKPPLKVAGKLRGLLANPGLIEGIAVAAAPREDADLTIRQWARAMRDLDLLPPMDRLFQLGFLGTNSSAAYTASGAFLSWFRQHHGADALKRWYAGATPSDLVGMDLATLDRAFRASLDSVEISDAQRAVAKARFDRPAVFGRKCPHVVDGRYQIARGMLERGDARGASEECHKVLALDPNHVGARLTLGTCALRIGRDDLARQHFGDVAKDERLTPGTRARGTEALADLALVRGRDRDARRLYDRVRKLTAREHPLRNQDVKRAAMEMSPAERHAIVSLLIGSPRYGRDWVVSSAALGQWHARDRRHGLAAYLLGKNLFNRGRYEDAVDYLDEAMRRELMLPRIIAEARRTRFITACALGDLSAASRWYRVWLGSESVSAARAAGMRRFAARCGVAVKADGDPRLSPTK